LDQPKYFSIDCVSAKVSAEIRELSKACSEETIQSAKQMLQDVIKVTESKSSLKDLLHVYKDLIYKLERAARRSVDESQPNEKGEIMF